MKGIILAGGSGDPIAIPKDLLSSDMAIIDMIYRPTPLLAYAEELGCKVADGKEMLLYQGVKSFSIWTGIDNPPVEAMRQGLMEAMS